MNDTGARADADFEHAFDRAMNLQPVGPDRLRGHTEAAYWNMVGPYGGIVAAVVMRALMLRADRVGDPLQLTVNFAGPLKAGPFDVVVDARRTNRTTQHWSIEIEQPADDGNGAQVVAIATATTATRRTVWSQPEARPPEVPGPEGLERLGPRGNLRWPTMYDMRYVQGLPLQPGDGTSLSMFWIRDQPHRTIDYPALTALCDASFPRIFVVRGSFTPIATVSMNIYFHGSAQALADDGNGHLLTVSEAKVFDAGFFDQHSTVWSPGRRLLASTQQIVWYKE